MSIEENKAIARKWAAAFDAADVTAIDELAAPSFMHSSEGNLQQFKDGAVKYFAEYRLQTTIEEVIAEGDKVAYQWTMRSTLVDDPGARSGVTILRIENGKIVEDRHFSRDSQDQD